MSLRVKSLTGNDRKGCGLFPAGSKKGLGYWPFEVNSGTKALNSRVIEKQVYFADEILFWFPPSKVIEKEFPTVNKLEKQAFLRSKLSYTGQENDNLFSKLEFIATWCQKREIVIDRNHHRRIVQKDRYDTGERGKIVNLGYLVMLYDGRLAKKVHRAAYREQFKITSSGWEHEKSLLCRQLDGILIRYYFYDDQSNSLRIREGYLVSKVEESYLIYQILVWGKILAEC